LPHQLIQTATRGAILARGADGVPLLVQQLQSNDKQRFALGLAVVRELPGRQATEALAAEVSRATPERQALLLLALADRNDPHVAPLIVKAARSGPAAVRVLAMGALPRLDEAAAAPVLLDAATEKNPEVSRAALAAIDNLQGDAIDRLIAQRLAGEPEQGLLLLIDLAGRRHVTAATPLLWKATDDPNATVQMAAIAALGGTVAPADLPRLVARLTSSTTRDTSAALAHAVQAAVQRMPDREACAAIVADAIAGQSKAGQSRLLELLGSIGGAKALAIVAATARGDDEQLRDTAFRALGQWMSLDAAPIVLELAQQSKAEKYQVRAVRAYIRLARQFDMPAAQRAEMCRRALKVASRLEEKRLVLEILLRYPSPEMHALALEAAATPELKAEAEQLALNIAGASGGDTKQLRKALAQAGHQTVKLEILQARYGEGDHTKDVTAAVRQCAGNLRILFLPSSNYNQAFGGDPAPGTVKQLTIRYRINGHPGEVVLAENATIVLPMPK
jgi:HEAT repeat protein